MTDDPRIIWRSGAPILVPPFAADMPQWGTELYWGFTTPSGRTRVVLFLALEAAVTTRSKGQAVTVWRRSAAPNHRVFIGRDRCMGRGC